MISTISIEELHQKTQSLKSDELVLDVRTPDEFSEGHVPGARNIPHDEVGQHAHELKPYARIYVYCRSGGRVQYACHELTHLGLKNLVAVVDGGMPDWEMMGYPVEK